VRPSTSNVEKRPDGSFIPVNKRNDKAVEYLDRMLKYYPDTPAAKEARTERDRLIALKPTK